MPAQAPQLDWVRSLKLDGHPEFGRNLHQLLNSYKENLDMLEQQTNSSLNGTAQAPPGLQAISVVPTDVGHHISINHGAEFYRGLYYHVEYADNPHFTNPFPAYSGPAREIDLATGPRRLWFRAFASYQNSSNTPLVYHGGQTPKGVMGGAAFRAGQSQGSGTGLSGEGHSGFGTTAFRGSKPPIR